MYAKLNKIQNSQRSLLELEMRKPFTTSACQYLTGTAVFMATLIFLYYVDVLKHARTEDALPSAEDPKFSPKTRSIFFHETYFSRLTVRQACAVEAAARAHPKKEIYVLFSVPVTKYQLKTGCLADLLQFPNVKFLRVHAAEYSRGSVLQSMLLNDVLQSRFRIQHIADILRILTLNKWGGIYLDTDMIVTKSLEDLPANFVAKQSENEVASAIISFAKDEVGTNVTKSIIKEISKKYNPSEWSQIGVKAIDRVIHALCSRVVSPEDFRSKPFVICQGVTIFDFELFYPHYFSDVDEMFKPAPEDFDLNRPYTYHMFDFLTNYMKISRGTVYELVAKAFCPTIHNKYSDEFYGKVNKMT